MIDPTDLVERYSAMWNEPDPPLRREMIRSVFAPDSTLAVEPPEEIRDMARNVGIPRPMLEVNGYDELEIRVTRAHDEFVAPGTYFSKSFSHSLQRYS